MIINTEWIDIWNKINRCLSYAKCVFYVENILKLHGIYSNIGSFNYNNGVNVYC